MNRGDPNNPRWIWDALDEVVDPEIPTVSLVELGIVRSVNIQAGRRVHVTITPTFSGCPAQWVMRDAIIEKLNGLGYPDVQVEVALSPPWSSEEISESGREKLKRLGLAPPPRSSGLSDLLIVETSTCPYCNSENTELRNSFGSTLCRSIYYCNNCQQPYDQFKPL